MRTVTGLVWDMDGTLIDSATVVPDAFIATTAALGGLPPSRGEVVAAYSLGEPMVMLSHLLDRPATRDDVALYHRSLAERAAGVRAYPGIVAVLDQLHGQLPMAVFTGASARAAQILLGAVGLLHRFEAVVGGDQVARPKPYPDGILAACRALGLPSRDCAYVGDASVDLQAASASGALPLAAGWGHLHQPRTDETIVLAQPADLIAVIREGRPPGGGGG